jgi:hypothetical protein
MKSVLICCPTHHGESGLFRAGFGDLILNRIPGWEFSWYEVGGCGITHARDIGAARAIKEDYDVLLFIASDIGFTAKHIQKVLSHFERDPSVAVVGGMYLLKKFPYRMCLNQPDRTRVSDPATDLLEVYETGTDFMAISVESLKKVVAAHPELRYDDYDDLDTPETRRGIAWNIFNMGVVEENGKRRFLTEDFWWCRYARKAGYKIHVDTSIQLKHDGRYVYDAEIAMREITKALNANKDLTKAE